MRVRRGLAFAALALAVLGGCGDSGDSDGAAPASTTAASGTETDTVVLKGNQFRPERIRVSVGDTVTWRWEDGAVPHDVNGGDEFKSEIQESGTFEHTFTEAGTFEYTCTVHPTMEGSVEVTD